MTFNNNPFDLPHHPPAELDVKPEIFDDLDSTLIDSNMLSGATMERKDSFATTSSTFFSPQSSTNPWGEESFSIPTSGAHHERHMSISSQIGDPVIGSNNPFLNHQNFPSWPPVYGRGPDSKTSMAPSIYEPFPADFDATSSANFQPSVAAASPFGGAVPMLNNVRPAAIMPPSADAAPLSTSPPPHQGKEWMALAEQDMDAGRLPKRMRQNSPPRPLTPGFARRDGVRKKNARFEIPEGRNLANIDRLIQQATTEEDVKELKQQKRLLRNRQAALDSRQRKKKHTEELEKEQKIWLDHRSELESQLHQLQEQFSALKVHAEQVEQQRNELEGQVHALTHEKETMVEVHTLETGNLRKRITTLSEQLERSPATMPSHSSNDFSDIDLDQFTIDNEWDIFNGMVDDDDLEPSIEKVSNTTTLVVGKPRKDTIMEDMQPLASGGFLLMLLLYGAIVASKSGTNAPPMPGMSDEMRAASAHIVDNILKDGNSAPQSSIALTASRVAGMQAAPSMPAWIQPDTVADKQNSINLNIISTPSRVASKLDTLASNLVSSSKLAEDEAAFGLTAAQYNSMTSNDYTPRRTYLPDDGSDVSPGNGRKTLGGRTLGEALRQMREEAGGRPVSEVYTRSLLGERIPEHVLRDFRKLVEEGRAEKARVKQEI